MPPFDHTWLPYIYLYGVGGVFFATGIILTRKSGSLDLRKKRHRKWYRILLFGYLWFMALHAVSIVAALYW